MNLDLYTFLGYQNQWDGLMDFNCGDYVQNGFLVGFKSVHDNGKEDRRYNFYCCNANGESV